MRKRGKGVVLVVLLGVLTWMLMRDVPEDKGDVSVEHSCLMQASNWCHAAGAQTWPRDCAARYYTRCTRDSKDPRSEQISSERHDAAMNSIESIHASWR
jgi:hypothetical protein